MDGLMVGWMYGLKKNKTRADLFSISQKEANDFCG
jgi:hypothetical protein